MRSAHLPVCLWEHSSIHWTVIKHESDTGALHNDTGSKCTTSTAESSSCDYWSSSSVYSEPCSVPPIVSSFRRGGNRKRGRYETSEAYFDRPIDNNSTDPLRKESKTRNNKLDEESSPSPTGDKDVGTSVHPIFVPKSLRDHCAKKKDSYWSEPTTKRRRTSSVISRFDPVSERTSPREKNSRGEVRSKTSPIKRGSRRLSGTDNSKRVGGKQNNTKSPTAETNPKNTNRNYAMASDYSVPLSSTKATKSTEDTILRKINGKRGRCHTWHWIGTENGVGSPGTPTTRIYRKSFTKETDRTTNNTDTQTIDKKNIENDIFRLDKDRSKFFRRRSLVAIRSHCSRGSNSKAGTRVVDRNAKVLKPTMRKHRSETGRLVFFEQNINNPSCNTLAGEGGPRTMQEKTFRTNSKCEMSRTKNLSKRKLPRTVDESSTSVGKNTRTTREACSQKAKNKFDKNRVSYKATGGSNQRISKYTLDMISLVCNNSYGVDPSIGCSQQRKGTTGRSYHYQQVHRLLDKPLFDYIGETEPEKERLMRLQLRQRFASATSTRMSPIEFSRKLLTLWGGKLDEVVVEGQK